MNQSNRDEWIVTSLVTSITNVLWYSVSCHSSKSRDVAQRMWNLFSLVFTPAAFIVSLSSCWPALTHFFCLSAFKYTFKYAGKCKSEPKRKKSFGFVCVSCTLDYEPPKAKLSFYHESAQMCSYPHEILQSSIWESAKLVVLQCQANWERSDLQMNWH